MPPLPVLLWMVLLAVLTAVLLHGLHRWLRVPATARSRPLHALQELEPRGGRHRVSVRLFEVYILAQIWLVSLYALLLFAPLAATAPARAWLAVAVIAISLFVGTWWAWRRGALRPAEPGARTTASERELPP